MQCKNNNHSEVKQDIKQNYYYPQHKKYPEVQNFDNQSLKINNIENQCIIKEFQSTNNKNLQLLNIKNSVIVVFDTIKCLTADNLENCHILIAACDGSIFLRDSKNVRISGICTQFRMKNCNFCSCFISVKTQPVIEYSQNILFGPFLYSIDSQNEQDANNQIQQINKNIEKALEHSQQLYANNINNYSDVFDFTPNENKQNYESIILPEKQHQNLWQQPPNIKLQSGQINVQLNEQKAIFVTNGIIPIIKTFKDVQNKKVETFNEIQGIYTHIQWKKEGLICYKVLKNQNEYEYYLC